MKIEVNAIDSSDRMYCPSTNEVIFAPDSEEINEGEAFMGYWHSEVLYDPAIKNPDLKAAWEEFYEEKWDTLAEEFFPAEIVEKFLKEYQNDEWKVIDCGYGGIACGPTSFNVYFVVKADTIIEEDPDWDEEVYEESMKNKSQQELDEYYMQRQIESLIRASEREKE